MSVISHDTDCCYLLNSPGIWIITYQVTTSALCHCVEILPDESTVATVPLLSLQKDWSQVSELSVCGQRSVPLVAPEGCPVIFGFEDSKSEDVFSEAMLFIAQLKRVLLFAQGIQEKTGMVCVAGHQIIVALMHNRSCLAQWSWMVRIC